MIRKNARRKTNRGQASTKAIKEYSAGGAVYKKVESKLFFLLIQDPKGRWSFPKGHVESGETLDQTALREITEETGVKKMEIIDKLDKIHFFYRMEGKLIFMTTFLYLIKATDPREKLIAQESEGIIGARWFEEKKALDIIEYKDTKILLEKAIKMIRSQGGDKKSPRNN